GLEQSLQVLQKRRVPRRQPRAPPALATHLPGQRAGVLQILQTASDRASGDLRRTRGGRDPAVAGRLRLGGGTQPSASLVKRGTKRFKSDTEGRFIYHCHDIDAGLEDRNPPNSRCRQNPKPDSPVSGRRLMGPTSGLSPSCNICASPSSGSWRRSSPEPGAERAQRPPPRNGFRRSRSEERRVGKECRS